MPLMYLPLILYTGWMELLLQPLRSNVARDAADAAHDMSSEAAQ
jgi:hypothetical protein